MNDNQAVTVLSLANILEAGKRVLKNAKSEDFIIPEGANVEEDLAAAIASEVRNQKIDQGIA
ncbi:hypothetical protein CPT_Moabite_179 [Serratia phage Moabite]|uniref:Uncharacterized protein n=3 Tax=Moabitevirus TaxID=2843422 RepID=A0A7T3NBU4_9CAUD|nr:hypothetical protein HWB23_gp103 [Serratia phage vB_SmaM_ 2050HW]YP_009849273.1 hypothetical protein HWC48_gp237 [Serratia phage Moabite]QPX76644.1 hypothetical protein [Serratia phage vB_SmaM_Yaphecito]UCR74709.1 hypothetical protein [Serratia phage BUCT660]UGO54066.1 hypothetical protein HAYMO_84 [Serratia phage vB_SmaM_Haymo]UQT03575.1 hypothetical protein KODAMA_01080 [Serratia phage vB_SmaM-Kodama]URG14279.1 hypothetical protein [Pectobacterium phage vB_ParM-25]